MIGKWHSDDALIVHPVVINHRVFLTLALEIY